MGTILSTVNWADTATIAPASGVTETLDFDNLKLPWGRGLARGDIGGSSVIVINVDLGAAKTVKTIGIRGMNGAVSAMSVSASLLTQTGSEVLNAETADYTDEWGFPFGASLWIHAETGWSMRYLQVTVDVTGGTYVDGRRLWIGDGCVIDGVDMGWSVDVVDGSRVERSSAGGVFATINNRWRRVRCAATRRLASEIVGDQQLLQRLAYAGRGREVVLSIRRNNSDARMRYLQTVHGQLTDWAPFVNSEGDIWGIQSLTVEEAPLPALG